MPNKGTSHVGRVFGFNDKVVALASQHFAKEADVGEAVLRNQVAHGQVQLERGFPAQVDASMLEHPRLGQQIGHHLAVVLGIGHGFLQQRLQLRQLRLGVFLMAAQARVTQPASTRNPQPTPSPFVPRVSA